MVFVCVHIVDIDSDLHVVDTQTIRACDSRPNSNGFTIAAARHPYILYTTYSGMDETGT